MTVNPVPRRVPVAMDPPDGPTRLARWAVLVAGAVAVVVTASYAIFFVALGVGGDAAISDTWVGYLGGLALVGGLAASLVAFAMAVAARLRHERWTLLWLPLTLFPALATITVVAELFWME